MKNRGDRRRDSRFSFPGHFARAAGARLWGRCDHALPAVHRGGNYDIGSFAPKPYFAIHRVHRQSQMDRWYDDRQLERREFHWPTVNVTPVLANTFQNTLSQWFSEFDAWFYSVTGVQLSGIMLALLNLFSWVLGLAQQAVNWLLGVFH